MKRQFDVVALVLGVLLSGVAGVSLWQTFVGGLTWDMAKIAVPLLLVAVGVVGLALSRNRT